MRQRKRVMLTVDKENYERFQHARLAAGLPADLLGKQVDKMIEAALFVCDRFGVADRKKESEDIEKAIIDVIAAKIKEGNS